MEKGIPEENIFGEDMNYKYKGNLGVYNSADECYVASEIYKNGRYADLYSICSPNQMLRKQLFYTQPEDIEDYELRLREMQLFVVPVTTKLLINENRAMNVEVPVEFKNHIPVLPLMQESGLDNVFNAKFGDLQYLYKYDPDPKPMRCIKSKYNYSTFRRSDYEYFVYCTSHSARY